MTLLVSLSGTALAQDVAAAVASHEKMKDIHRVLEASGAGDMGVQMMNEMFSMQRQMLPQVPEEVWQEMRSAFDPAELNQITAVIWDKHFTHDEVRGLLVFHESAVGRRMRELQPVILKESMEAGHAWGMEVMKRVADRLRQKGLLPGSAPPAPKTESPE